MLPQSATSYYETQQRIAVATAAGAKKFWRRMGPDFDSSWADVVTPLLNWVQTGRAAAVASSIGYTADVLQETNVDAAPVGVLSPAGFLSSAPDGRSMGSLLGESVVKAKSAVGSGLSAPLALQQAERWLTGTLLTVMSDTGRSVVAAGIAQRPTLQGYTRMLNPPSCSRCAILAGKFFRWNSGFLRHPRCDCRHIPTNENMAGDLTTDPYKYFHSLSPEAQEKTFGRSEARAIREGADIYRVGNIQQRGLATSKGHLRYGTPSRMTVDDIFRTAGTRTNAIKMLEHEGYITGPQVAGGNIVGRIEGFGALGKGGKARAASDAVKQARETGVRDPLNRYTMTAAERRLYDAKYKLDVARTGVYPRTVGLSSADKYVAPKPITPMQLAHIEQAYANEVAKLATSASSVRRLAQLLGI
ncbi:hypothetical protein [Subtercola boreus]|nr:hypothetical protein [Subtercola boreus]